ncbi:hypothetical protein SA2016_0823 [Sinomonas atrocyanea]|uniref:DUF1508 domain-containing protein n=2 Tax=Sinomonas atrocyanea TaxID=37927 RepID=A0A126ZY58_9MICC|nr:hypothetical protein SA2016_0823 [Sinomonas atrocyanea]
MPGRSPGQGPLSGPHPAPGTSAGNGLPRPGSGKWAGMAELNVYQRPDSNWGWRLISDNGNVIATDGGQGYEHESVAQTMAEQVITGHYKDARTTRKGLHDRQ